MHAYKRATKAPTGESKPQTPRLIKLQSAPRTRRRARGRVGTRLLRGRVPVSRRRPRMHYVRIGNYHKWARKTHCFDPRVGIKTWGTTGIQKLIPINTESDASSVNVQPGICRLKVIAVEENGCAFSLQDPTVRERRPCISCCFSCMVHSVWGAGYVFCIIERHCEGVGRMLSEREALATP